MKAFKLLVKSKNIKRHKSIQEIRKIVYNYFANTLENLYR
ncbi:MAG: hypothetical protein JETT_0345 [Candidatus Jettenia ecosi]|uniref:Uncharacterized protein n=1 Tax=Candidatus Jettenia ecosi TaxID=2494326 RepID=A0A533QRU7_9BACT|nr:MAG: hypothetical protein JETT_0345 [Candidatus Jettenia ecosi]